MGAQARIQARSERRRGETAEKEKEVEMERGFRKSKPRGGQSRETREK